MAFDFKFKKIKQSSDENGDVTVNPVSLFYKLDQKDIKDLYPVQRDVLQGWYEASQEGKKANIISLDTGTGKTLVGLLISDSLRRSENGKVLYVCPNNYLIEQTTEKAKEYGIDVATYKGGAWTSQAMFLQNKAVCITNYDSVYNSRSIFEREEIVGYVFDDAHLSLEIIDKQYSLSIKKDSPVYSNLIKVLKEHSNVQGKLENVEEEDPRENVFIPLTEWYSKSDTIKKIIASDTDVAGSLQWGYVKDVLKKTLCFVNRKKIEISLLYPNTKDHYLFDENIHKVYLSATLPNRDDLMRILDVDVNRIESKNPDYRPERLFVFSKLLKLDPAKQEDLYKFIPTLSPKTLVLVPNRLDLEKYEDEEGTVLVKDTKEIKQKIDDFKKIESSTLVLMNRYDGIDLPGDMCHSLVIDGLPFNSSLKTRFFSEYFHNQKNVFMRSILASKLVQAFGRTVRGYNDFSVVFLLGDKLNQWILNKDNNKFFREDVIDDFEIGIEVSSHIESTEDLNEMTKQMLSQGADWKEFVKNRRKVTVVNDFIDVTKENTDLNVAKIEREIVNAFYENNYITCIKLIMNNQKLIRDYSKPVLGLYLSIASVCALELKDTSLASKLSAHAYGINPLFGEPLQLADIKVSQQAQRIVDNNDVPPTFIWESQSKDYNRQYDEDLKNLGECLGFTTSRPDTKGDGTLDVLWVNEEKRIALGIELKLDKTNSCLSKSEIDQCLGHQEWLNKSFPDYTNKLYVVGDFKYYNKLGSPADIRYFSNNLVKELIEKTKSLYKLKNTKPEVVDAELVEKNLTPETIFPESFIKDLEAKEQ